MQWIKKSEQQLDPTNKKSQTIIKNNAVFIIHIINNEIVKTKFLGEYKEPYDAVPVYITYNMGEQNNLGTTTINFDYSALQPDTLYKIEMLDGSIQAFINRNSLLEHYVYQE